MSHGTGRIAKKYAIALFDAVPHTDLENTREALNLLSLAWSHTPDLKVALLNPKLNPEQHRSLATQIIAAIKSDIAVNRESELVNLLLLLIQNKRIGLIAEIALQFSTVVDEFKAALTIQITSAFQLSPAEKKEYEDKVKKDLGALVTVDWKIDSELIGGMLIKSGDKLIDSSVKGSLKRMAAQLLA